MPKKRPSLKQRIRMAREYIPPKKRSLKALNYALMKFSSGIVENILRVDPCTKYLLDKEYKQSMEGQ